MRPSPSRTSSSWPKAPRSGRIPTTRAKSNDKLYDGTIFHRVIPDFMIQGGDPAGTGMGGPGYRFEDETKGSPHKFDKPGKLAMANSGPNTNGSQFFITVAPTAWLTGKHTIFGEVVEGQDIVVEDLQGPAQRAGQAAQARGAGIGGHRARRVENGAAYDGQTHGTRTEGGTQRLISLLSALFLRGFARDWP